jgi:hypothetical protein
MTVWGITGDALFITITTIHVTMATMTAMATVPPMAKQMHAHTQE